MDASNSNLQTPPLKKLKTCAISTTTNGSVCNNSSNSTSVPIHIVTRPSQLPVGFLVPSPENQLVVGLDCEGVNLSRTGTLCVMQLAFADAIYLVDAIEGGAELMEACKPALESKYVTKVIHDCRKDSEALYFQFGIKLNNVMDTQIAYNVIDEQEGKTVGNDISFVAVLADPRYCGVSYHDKEEIRGLLKQDPSFWIHRPLSEIMIKSATDDVKFLLSIYQKMMDKLTKQSLWRVFVRGVLYCQYFCVDDYDADWLPLPKYPDELGGEQNAPEREILSVLTVPFGSMGRVIGRKGSTVQSVRQSSNAKISIPREAVNKVFIIGLPDEVRRARALIREKFYDAYDYIY